MPNPSSVAIMSTIDLMPMPMRMLVYEYGFSIVWAMVNDGYNDPGELRSLLEMRRQRKQAEWLATDYVQPKMWRN